MDADTLLRTLADGEYHAGDDIARALADAERGGAGARLADWGLLVTGSPAEGYRLEQALDLVHAEAVEARLAWRVRALLDRLDVFTELDSTNRHLLEHPPPPGRLAVCIAEFQHAGRGRRGRRWHAPLGAALCLSMAWHPRGARDEATALGLAVGLAARRAVAEVTGKRVRLKWPNDLVWDDRKLGGILLERAGRRGAAHVVAGVGINVAIPARALPGLSDYPGGAIDLARLNGGLPPSKAALAGALISAVTAVFEGYERWGFAPYLEEWRAADYLQGRRVRVEAGAMLEGRAVGIEADGALLLETAGGELRRVVSGDVTVRGAS